MSTASLRCGRPGLPHRSFVLSLCLLALSTAGAQRVPHIGYIYPAGGQRATTFEVIVGGQGLEDPTGTTFSGEGVQAEVLEHIKPLGAVRAGDIHEKLREMQGKMKELRKDGKLTPQDMLPTIRRLLQEAEVTEKDLRQVKEYDRKRNDPKQQLNSQIGETVRLKVTISDRADSGIRQFRLRTSGGLSNPMRFEVGQLPEIREAEAPLEFDFEHYSGYSAKRAAKQNLVTPTTSLPVTINGRILPGEVDKFTFHATKGEQVVLAVWARRLIPYLADAVPGWFQAVASLYDSSGRELAFAGGYRFDPDPVLFYKIPYDGDFRIEVHDSIYRGREDFVYRMTVGELPFLTGISPLGAKAGAKVNIIYGGGNLGEQRKLAFTAPDEPGIIAMTASNGPWRSNAIPFQVDTIPEEPEHEPNNSLGGAHEIKPPVVIDGRIDPPGDVDFYRLKGPGNRPVVFEVFARRLGSPLDANLTVYDNDGKQIAYNDDHEDQASGLTTHHADSRIFVKMPPTGQCFVRVADTQNQGGISFAYRLRVTPARPSFALRATPSTLNAKPGGSAKLTVHALRSEGFEGEITLKLKGAPEQFTLANAKIPAGKDVADVSITVPSSPSNKPIPIRIEGSADIDGRTVTVAAVPAEDMMQAFIYRHLVPVDELLIDVRAEEKAYTKE